MATHILPTCRTADGLEYEYHEYPWGDCIEGSQDVLLRMGIGSEKCFPGDPGRNKHQVKTTDPRGFPCTIKLARWSQFPYVVYIFHPGREYHNPAEEWREVFPGVQCQEAGHGKSFKGSDESLTAAGIVPKGMFPGMPGMRSVRVTILADGSLPAGHRNSNKIGKVAMTIEKIGKHTYQVRVAVSSELGAERLAAYWAHRHEWENRMAAMPRAPRLDQAIRNELNAVAKQKRADLHLVWSRPKFVPGFNTLPQGPFAR